MIEVLLYISGDSRLLRREAQHELITVFCDFCQETSEIVIKYGFICEIVSVGSLITNKCSHQPQSTIGLLLQFCRP